jgi:hypothetical protein
MYIEAVTVCVGCADFLGEAETYNRGLIDRLVVVTTPDDQETRTLCRNRGMECLLTEDFRRSGPGTFDKSRGVDRALQMLTHQDWVMHLDCDIVLPGHFRETLEDAHLDPQGVYGCDRVMIRSWEEWQAVQKSNFLRDYSRREHHSVCWPTGYSIGARWADTVQGYVPIGFLQLWHSSADMWWGIRTKRYPTVGHSDASRTDVQFALQWDRRHRHLIPELIVLHLESEPAPVGVNWKGRKTKRFGPEAKTPTTVVRPS